mmetsp:Transcript_2352/g.6034  ORF Transcript_2352/g.6034 Transcript_2352/m.6034 type:complete len:100 (+) Transcript_2352:318-617(+)
MVQTHGTGLCGGGFLSPYCQYSMGQTKSGKTQTHTSPANTSPANRGRAQPIPITEEERQVLAAPSHQGQMDTAKELFALRRGPIPPRSCISLMKRQARG